MKNIFVFTMRDTDTQSAREKVLDAMRKAGKEAGVSNFRYIMTQSTCLVNDDISSVTDISTPPKWGYTINEYGRFRT